MKTACVLRLLWDWSFGKGFGIGVGMGIAGFCSRRWGSKMMT